MKNNKNIAKHVFLSGSIIAGAVLGFGIPNSASANNLFNYGSLGSGSELRSSLLSGSVNRNLDLSCGSKNTSKTEKPAKENKTKEATCGGEKKMENKTKDAKCGEGKCGGDKKMENKSADKKMESKAKDAKCGEGKCGSDKKDMKKSAEKKETQPAEKKNAEPAKK